MVPAASAFVAHSCCDAEDEMQATVQNEHAAHTDGHVMSSELSKDQASHHKDMVGSNCEVVCCGMAVVGALYNFDAAAKAPWAGSTLFTAADTSMVSAAAAHTTPPPRTH